MRYYCILSLINIFNVPFVTITFSLGDKFDEFDSPDTSLNRQDIAMGVTPIAARESVVKYQVTTT